MKYTICIYHSHTYNEWYDRNGERQPAYRTYKAFVLKEEEESGWQNPMEVIPFEGTKEEAEAEAKRLEEEYEKGMNNNESSN